MLVYTRVLVSNEACQFARIMLCTVHRYLSVRNSEVRMYVCMYISTYVRVGSIGFNRTYAHTYIQ